MKRLHFQLHKYLVGASVFLTSLDEEPMACASSPKAPTLDEEIEAVYNILY